MKTKTWLSIAAAALAALMFHASRTAQAADVSSPAASAALTGKVTSQEEGAMEGVLVSAKKTGSPISYTVATNASGAYAFPTSKLEPGQYTLKTRAEGYDLDDPGMIDVASGKAATA